MYQHIIISIFLIINFLISQNMSGYDLAKMIDQKTQPISSKSEISMTLIAIFVFLLRFLA